MKLFTIHEGKFVGDHKIYESKEEMLADQPNIEYRDHWFDKDLKPGMFAKSDCGHYMELLHTYSFPNKSLPWRKTVVLKFPVGQTMKWTLKSGEWKYKGFRPYIDRKFQQHKVGTFDGYWFNKKKVGLMQGYINANMDPYEAFIKVFYPPGNSKVVTTETMRSHFFAIIQRYGMVINPDNFADKVRNELQKLEGDPIAVDSFLAKKIAKMLHTTQSANSLVKLIQFIEAVSSREDQTKRLKPDNIEDATVIPGVSPEELKEINNENREDPEHLGQDREVQDQD